MPVHHFPNSVSRREFLKLAQLSVASLCLTSLNGFVDLNPDLLGRVTAGKVYSYQEPSLNSLNLKTYYKDTVLPIYEVTVGDGEPKHNRVWYRIGQGEFVHSGSIQPVKTRVNPVVEEIPETGVLAEVSVPFTEARWSPGKDQSFAYRFYYESTFWVTAALQDESGEWWYRVPDDKWINLTYYVLAKHLRVIPAEELTPLSPEIPYPSKRIEVRLADQVVIAYEMDHPIYMARAATGTQYSRGKFLTPTGRFRTFYKTPYRHMAAGDLAADGYDLPGVPWVCSFTEKGVALHGTYWHNDYGRPRSHGCVNLTPGAAKWFYRWTVPITPPDQQSAYNYFGTILDVIG